MSARRPVAVVTGGRRGIGLGIARSLAKAGFDLAITGIEADAPDAVLSELCEMGGRVIYLQADLSDVAGHARTAATIEATLGGIDCLVNNAGMGAVERGDFLALTPENFDRIIDVNLRGTVFFTQAVVGAMLAGGGGEQPRTVINITSVSASMSSPERLDYCISKAALSAFSQGLALRLAESGIAVFEVRPGIIRSDMTAKVAEKYDALIDGGLVPMKRWGEAGDVGAIVAALAKGDFGFATGSVMSADGGLSIGRL
ncbi:3-ketoacyl-ACP reductase [Rhizobium sp. RAF56]|jgi:NAD(P)-dependent dehydrogenase (short-subunit alcohol dehydrogenase family)|uniref:3-ketoacyl-ACP reductase n=1 Tax=Rhizobium sp. RAF56 TaxID=3233062 RepID=UPI003F9D900D